MATTYDPTTADAGVVQKVPAGKVVIDLNVRLDIRLDKSFVSSIRVYGFEQLPVGYFDDDGNAHVTIGQRRVSAALEIGWPVIPLIIKTKVDAEADRAEELRILRQLAENEQRLGLHQSETAAAYKQLSLFGVTEDQIARKTNAPKARVTTALKVADSTIATEALTAMNIDLEQAAILTEFEDDSEAIAQLLQTATERPARLEHEAGLIRQQRAALAACDILAAELEAAGWEVHRADDSWNVTVPPGARRIGELYRPKKDGGVRSIGKPENREVLKLTGRFAAVFPYYGEAKATYYITDPNSQGLVDWSGHPFGAKSGKGPLSDAEKDARREKRLAKQEMIAATDVRRTWIRDTLLNPSRKSYPDDAITWIARELWHARGTLRDRYGASNNFIMKTLLDVEPTFGSYQDPDTGSYHSSGDVEQLFTTTRDPLRLALAAAVGHTEEVVGNPKADSFGQDPRTAVYLRQLRDWGYTLADVEQRIVDAADQHALNSQIAAEVKATAADVVEEG